MRTLPLQFSSKEPQINPSMVALARESRGLSQQELATKLNVTQSRLSKIESGLLTVPPDLLERMSTELHYPEPFFQQGGPTLGIGVTEIYHRKRANVPKKVLDQIHAQIEIKIRQMAALLRAVEIPTKLRRLDAEEYGGRPEDIAKLTRASWQLPRGPIPDLTHVLEDAGIVVIHMDFGTTRVDAIGRWVPGFPPIIFANRTAPMDRLRFSLAHELGHLVMHEHPSPTMESEADSFAAEFLVPGDDAHADFMDLDLARLVVLKRFWRTSMSMLLYRAKDLGRITPNRAKMLWSQMSKHGYTTREPVELDIDGERPRLLREAVSIHCERLEFSLEDLGVLLNLFKDELVAEFGLAEERSRFRTVGN